MHNIPKELKYTPTHEWIRQEADGTLTVGITEHAQTLLGDLVFVQLPTVGDEFKLGQDTAVVESVKAASDVYAPVSGKIIACNDALNATPELINQAPYAEGWIFKLQPTDNNEITKLLDAAAYEQQISH